MTAENDKTPPTWLRTHQLVRFTDKRSEVLPANPEEWSDRQKALDALKDGGYDSDEDHIVAELNEAEAITSWDVGAGNLKLWPTDTEQTQHRVVIDLDMEARLIPSSTPGHYHLYIDKLIPWDNYSTLLTFLEDCGIIEPGYANASRVRGYSAVRLPWVRK